MKDDTVLAVTVSVIALGLVIFFIGIFSSLNGDMVDEIRRGDKDLYCIMKDGERKIDNKQVVDQVDETWLFVNGSAKNCRVE